MEGYLLESSGVGITIIVAIGENDVVDEAELHGIAGAAQFVGEMIVGA